MEDDQGPEEWGLSPPGRAMAILAMVAASWALVIGIYLMATRHW